MRRRRRRVILQVTALRFSAVCGECPGSASHARRASRPARTVRERAEEVLVGEIRVLHAGSRGAAGPRGSTPPCDRDFTAPRPGMRLVGDMTELGTLEGKLYLATCIDLATREVAGWAMADHHRAELPVAALRMAAGRGGHAHGSRQRVHE
ncbi:hypothetical protein DVK44_17895 [Streptomyces paludis]|uniref:Integrase catalytic domain-containing protein n=2 Tax=Streptomyces paludis TaxID=2282738 RepID=A0A345HR96_9ACTN|nr:hypothetical protein DVK44_17895 [Streptomyces paludis]